MLCRSTWLSLSFLFLCSWHLLFWQDTSLQRSQVVISRCPGNQILGWSKLLDEVHSLALSVFSCLSFYCKATRQINESKLTVRFESIFGHVLTDGFVDVCSDEDKFPSLNKLPWLFLDHRWLKIILPEEVAETCAQTKVCSQDQLCTINPTVKTIQVGFTYQVFFSFIQYSVLLGLDLMPFIWLGLNLDLVETCILA